MRQPLNALSLLALGCLVLLAGTQGIAQGYDTPLTIQGTNSVTLHSAASRASGGLTLGVRNDASVMFANPALLSSIANLQISLGGMQGSTYTKQNQLYGGLQTHSAFNLLVEGVTDWISNPDTILLAPTLSDTVQRPFDTFGSDWSHKKTAARPIEGFIAAPFTLEGMPIVVGLGAVEYANLNRFYQNNNCFSPSVLSVLNGTISTSTLNATPYITQWYQYAQERTGSLYGYGLALSVSPLENLSLGVSGMYVAGSTDDYEVRVGRGQMVFYAAALRLTKQNVLSYTRTGTSDYKGTEMTFAASYRGRSFTAGFSVKPPMTITRDYTSQMAYDSVITVSRVSYRVDSLHATGTTAATGSDKVKLPWRGTVGISIDVRSDMTIGLEYELRPFAAAVYNDAAGAESKPWLSGSLWHVGVEYRAAEWLSLRGGARENAEVFEPVSNAIRGEAVKYTIYSLGAGLSAANVRLGIAYEYSDMKYIDTWSNAASINREIRNNVVATIAYDLPW
jgi:opacity protein-like surface antigen